MKKVLFVFLLFFYCILSLFSAPVSVKENFETMNFEIYLQGKKISELPFRFYCGYQILDNNIYFIDCSNSRIEEYGELCLYDTKQEGLKHLNIMTGSSFLCYKNYIFATSLTESTQNNDIEDVFNLGVTSKKYPLNICIYDIQNFKKIKDINLDKYREHVANNSLYLNFSVDSDYGIALYYSILDTTEVINIGYLDLESLEILKNN